MTDCSVDTWSTCGKYRVGLTLFFLSILLWREACLKVARVAKAI